MTAVMTGAVVAAVLESRPEANVPAVTVLSTVAVAASATVTTTTPSSSAPPTPACRGLSAPTITAGPGDTTTFAGVVAAFEYAYYVRRDVDAALQVTDPRAGLTREVLAAAITALPTGTTHCVAITPITDGAGEVHVVELHPDGTRFDYLQLVNTSRSATGPDPAGLVITNIQRRGN
ncbi:hypothetical protein ACFWUP_23775 [Nocardia sp. NPDC058658]|uniref:hypothetical protein n=1 Tax=Nocardia sp. NPDC058658 TaxID=3346580 RepID=UPI00365FE296